MARTGMDVHGRDMAQLGADRRGIAEDMHSLELMGYGKAKHGSELRR